MTGRDEAGRFMPGNRIWELAAGTPGRPRAFGTADELHAACAAFFAWCEANPLYEGFQYLGKVSQEGIPHVRAFTIVGLCLHLGIDRRTWYRWQDEKSDDHRDDLAPVCRWADEVIFEQKFTNAAAGLLKENIIGKDLGLADKHELTGDAGGPVQVQITRRIIDPAKDA